jgi:hypothetical protein
LTEIYLHFCELISVIMCRSRYFDNKFGNDFAFSQCDGRTTVKFSAAVNAFEDPEATLTAARVHSTATGNALLKAARKVSAEKLTFFCAKSKHATCNLKSLANGKAHCTVGNDQLCGDQYFKYGDHHDRRFIISGDFKILDACSGDTLKALIIYVPALAQLIFQQPGNAKYHLCDIQVWLPRYWID